MKISPEERARLREAFRQMSPAKKLEHIFTYYKLPIVLTLVALIVLGDVIHRQITKKEALLYAAYINVAVGEDLNAALDAGFVGHMGLAPKKNEVAVYRDLYLSRSPSTDNHQYAYASRLKLFASIESKELDIVLMNQESYDILSEDGYLYEIPSILAQSDPLYAVLEPYLTTNTVILEDNSIEYNLNEADVYEAVTTQAVNAIDVTTFPVFQNAGVSDHIYLGVIGNSPRLSIDLQYIAYLASEEAGARD